MEINFDLIKINWGITLLRPLNLILAFIPVYTYDKIERLTSTNFWGGWTLFWIVIFILQVLFLKRYRIIGQIKLTNESISIMEDANGTMSFKSNQNLSIVIKYNGFKGEQGNYKSLLQLPIFPRNGIGSMTILKEKTIYKYAFVSKKKNYTDLTKLSDIFVQAGNKVDISFNK